MHSLPISTSYAMHAKIFQTVHGLHLLGDSQWTFISRLNELTKKSHGSMSKFAVWPPTFVMKTVFSSTRKQKHAKPTPDLPFISNITAWNVGILMPTINADFATLQNWMVSVEASSQA